MQFELYFLNICPSSRENISQDHVRNTKKLHFHWRELPVEVQEACGCLIIQVIRTCAASPRPSRLHKWPQAANQERTNSQLQSVESSSLGLQLLPVGTESLHSHLCSCPDAERGTAGGKPSWSLPALHPDKRGWDIDRWAGQSRSKQVMIIRETLNDQERVEDKVLIIN